MGTLRALVLVACAFAKFITSLALASFAAALSLGAACPPRVRASGISLKFVHADAGRNVGRLVKGWKKSPGGLEAEPTASDGSASALTIVRGAGQSTRR